MKGNPRKIGKTDHLGAGVDLAAAQLPGRRGTLTAADVGGECPEEYKEFHCSTITVGGTFAADFHAGA